MVLDAGRLVEFDSPSNLLKKEGGFLKSLVDESGEREVLYAMATSKSSSWSLERPLMDRLRARSKGEYNQGGHLDLFITSVYTLWITEKKLVVVFP